MGSNDDRLLDSIRDAVLAIEPTAQVVLYGSRARGDALPDADWDLLVLLDGPVDGRRASAVRRRVYEIEWDTGEVLSTIVRSRQEWESTVSKATPFHAHVEREGVRL